MLALYTKRSDPLALPYDYYPAVLYAIDLVSQGCTVTDACQRSNISVKTFHSYVKKDAELEALYAEADQQGSDAMADALINIDNHHLHGQTDPQMARIVSDNIKWLLARRRPKDYGDRVQVDHSVTVDVAITTALDAGRNRVAALPRREVVEDAEIVEESDEALAARLLS